VSHTDGGGHTPFGEKVHKRNLDSCTEGLGNFGLVDGARDGLDIALEEIE
jgi:hypothetical protein